MEDEGVTVTEPIIRWRKGDLIGGRVFIGINLDTGELLAIKEPKKELEEEVKLLKNLSHPNIVRYLGTVKEEGSISILLEFVSGGSVSSLLEKFGSFPESVIRLYTKQLLLALVYLHKNGIVHRDIKGANILVDDKGCIKLADFGASKQVVELATVTGAMSMQGIPYWMAPDVNLQTGHSFSADIWSVGCTIIEMATRKPPWSQQYQEVAALFHIDTTNSHPPIPDHLSAEAKDFLLQCLQKEPELRPTACELLQHSFITKESWQSCLIASTSSMSFNPLCEPVDWSCKSDGTSEVECKTTLDDNKGIPVDVQHDLVSGGGSMKFYEVQRDWKEELDQEFGRKRVMDSDVLAHDTDVEFIFNESKHSDRTLRIEIVSDCDTLDSFSDLVRPWNHMTVDTAKKYYACSDSNSSMDTILKVETLHIFSPLLEAKSPFFRKLFSGGMKESAQLYVTLQINPSEKAALMELLEFMYSDTLRVTDSPALLDVLMIADKFDVPSCMRYCCDMLLKLPMTYDTSLLYLGLPSGVLMADTVQPLIGAAKQFLAVRFRDVSKFNDGIMRLPLVGIEALLASDELQVESEDALYDIVLKWSRIHYPEIQMRKDVMSRLCAVLRFPFMSSRKLEEVLYCTDLDPMLASKMVVEAFRFKADASFRQRVLAPKESAGDNRFVERGYKYRAVKIVHYSLPMHKCIVFMDLTRKDCEELFTLGRVDSQVIHLAGQGFFLSAHCNLDRQRSSRCFGLFLGKLEKGSAVSAIKYEFAVMGNFSEEYATIYKGFCDLPGGKAVGYRNLFGLHWSEFISQNDLHFIKDVLHLKCVITIQQ